MLLLGLCAATHCQEVLAPLSAAQRPQTTKSADTLVLELPFFDDFAEYEGLLSGRLLNNRLLINGQFGYRDNPNATTSFIGDFDIRYLLFPNGNLAVKVYNQANDRYFIKNSLNTQGVGLIMKKDFNGWRELLGIKRKEKKPKQK